VLETNVEEELIAPDWPIAPAEPRPARPATA
jgi:hypothetical protein